MDKIFWGFLLLFFNINLNLGNCTINLLPAWLGYLFLLHGAAQMLPESELFGKMRPWCTGMVAYTGVLWVMDILHFNFYLEWINVLLMLLSTLAQLYVSYLFIKAMTDVAQRRNADLQCAFLNKVWGVAAIADLASIVLLLIPALALISILVGFFAGLCFLVGVHNTRKAYRALCNQ